MSVIYFPETLQSTAGELSAMIGGKGHALFIEGESSGVVFSRSLLDASELVISQMLYGRTS